jgi:hypothetical protein
MGNIDWFLIIYITTCLALIAGIGYRWIKVRQSAIIIILLSYIGYGIAEYLSGFNNLWAMFCLGSLLFISVGLPMLACGYALDKVLARKAREK